MPRASNNYDINFNQLLNATFQILASDPGSPVEGQFWYNSTSDKFLYRANGVTVDVSDAVTLGGQTLAQIRARSSHTGTQTASTISDFDTQVRTNRLDQMAAPTADVAMNSRKLTGLLNGTSPQDAATFSQLEAVRQGVEYKEAVEAAMTTNVTVANPGTAVFDGVTVANSERVLLTGQSTGSENGIYVFNGSSSAMTRADDADAFTEIDAGSQTFAQGGTANSGIWRQNTELTSFTGQAWAKVGAGTTYIAGDGLTESPAGTFNVGGTASRISVAANAIDIDSAYVGQASITTLGTIVTGVWNGTDIAVADGGTGASTAAAARTNLGAVGKYSALIGNATSVTITAATHGLGAGRDKIVQTLLESDGSHEQPNISVAANGDVTIAWSVAPAASAIRVIIIG